MEFLFFIGGWIIGRIFHWAWKRKEKICGVIEVDHDTEQCKVHISSDELSNRKSKKAVFEIKHDAKISREKQSL